MKRRFTGNELYKLRNSIPIDRLIVEHLNIASKIDEGWFRFLCPICGEFDTATNPRTNLARCFRCEKNFNAIDLAMTVKGLGFIGAVEYLQTLLPGPEPEAAAAAMRRAQR